MAAIRLPGMSGSREWVYPQSIDGPYMKLRRVSFFLLHVWLFVAPWVTVKGHPLLQIDIPARRVFLVGSVFTPSDSLLLALLLFFLAFSLFFFTALFGRIWCGYACPQTVFLETWIRPLEILIEGDRSQRKRRDGQPLSFDRIWRKAVKWSAFALVAFLLSMSMVSLFAGARPLWTGEASGGAYAMVGFLTLAWYADFTWFREQFCIYLCPYARFQSALTDDETLLVSYDEARGEPRGPKRGPEGGCISCQKCVVVCPQGIDIRDGFQLECIQCARCIDACESVMARFDQPTLVRYSSIAADRGARWRKIRPRTVVYAGLLMALVGAMGTIVTTRLPFEATVNRTPGSLYSVDADGYVRNTYLLHVTNKEPNAEPSTFEVRLEGLEGAEVTMPELTLAAEEARTVPLVVRLEDGASQARTIPFRVVLGSRQGTLVMPTTFKTAGALEEDR